MFTVREHGCPTRAPFGQPCLRAVFTGQHVDTAREHGYVPSLAAEVQSRTPLQELTAIACVTVGEMALFG